MAEKTHNAQPIRCVSCSSVLLEAELIEGIIIKKCPKCGIKNTFIGEKTNKPASRSNA